MLTRFADAVGAIVLGLLLLALNFLPPIFIMWAFIHLAWKYW